MLALHEMLQYIVIWTVCKHSWVLLMSSKTFSTVSALEIHLTYHSYFVCRLAFYWRLRLAVKINILRNIFWRPRVFHHLLLSTLRYPTGTQKCRVWPDNFTRKILLRFLVKFIKKGERDRYWRARSLYKCGLTLFGLQTEFISLWHSGTFYMLFCIFCASQFRATTYSDVAQIGEVRYTRFFIFQGLFSSSSQALKSVAVIVEIFAGLPGTASAFLKDSITRSALFMTSQIRISLVGWVV